MTGKLSCLRSVKRLTAVVAVVASAVLGLGLVNSTEASAVAHPSVWAWSSTLDYGANAGWELDSPSGVYRAVFQTDHNFVVYHSGTAIWSSGTNGVALDTLLLTAGNYAYGGKGLVGAVVYCTVACSYPAGTKQWSNAVNDASTTHRLAMQDDGNFVEYTGASGGTALWSTRTNGK
jgi:hypothetical protein